MISKNLQKRFYTSLALLFLVFLIYNSKIILVFFLIIFGVISIIEFHRLIKKIFKNKFYSLLSNLFFIFYMFTFCYMFFFFMNFEGLKIILFILLLGCIASDIGGYIFGKIFKGAKLTKISPKKTYSGALGSIFFTIVVTTSLFYYFISIFNLEIFIIAIMTSISCQFGDLLFSYFKRKAKSKDTGNILPGHGGLLDRLDGIFLGIPFGFLTLILLN